MRRLIWPVLFLLLLILQGAVSVIMTGWLRFDLLLTTVYGFALFQGESKGAGAGFFVGLLQDSMCVSVFGFHMLSRAAVGYFTGLTKNKVFQDSYFYHVLIIGGFSFCISSVSWVLTLLQGGNIHSWSSYLLDTAGYCIGNMLLVIPMVSLCEKIVAWNRKEDISY